MANLRLGFCLALALAAGCKPRQASVTANANSGLEPLEYGNYRGGCTPDGRICGYFAPVDMPILAVGKAFERYIKMIDQVPANERGQDKYKVRIGAYNMNVNWYGFTSNGQGYLQQLLSRGVNVDFMADMKNSYGSFSSWSGLTSWYKNARVPGKLRTFRIPVLRGRTPQMHNKIIIFGQETVLFGSANWTFSGLVGNYENVMVVNGIDHVVKAFSDEIDELSAYGQKACELFNSDPGKCGTGLEGSTWNKSFLEIATKGLFLPADVDFSRDECRFLKYGLVSQQNLPQAGLSYDAQGVMQIDYNVLKGCFIDPGLGDKFAELSKFMADNERYADGKRVMDEPPRKLPNSSYPLKHDPTFGLAPNTRRIRTYFSPEDNIEWQMTKEFQKLYYKREQSPCRNNPAQMCWDYVRETVTDPATGRTKTRYVVDPEVAKKSFAYVSTNFITNKTIATQLVEFQAAGGHVRVFFDRGRWNDPNFQLAKDTLKPLTDAGDMKVFDNQLSGAYGCNHNKMAVLYSPFGGLRLVNGSANWSVGAMGSNDENLSIFEDERIAMIYLREILSQMYVYWFGQNQAEFDREIAVLMDDQRFPDYNKQCLAALLNLKDSGGQATTACDSYNVNRLGQPIDSQGQVADPNGLKYARWEPKLRSTYTFAVRFPDSMNNKPNPDNEHVFAWYQVEGEREFSGAEAFTADTFSGNWVTSLPATPGKKVDFKFFRKGKLFSPSESNINQVSDWEMGGNNRRSRIASPVYTVHGVDTNLVWGQR